MSKRRWMLLLILGAFGLFSVYRCCQPYTLKAGSEIFERHGANQNEPFLRFLPSEPKPMEVDHPESLFSSDDLLNSYLQMNVTNSSRFLSPQLTKVTVVPNPVPLRVGDKLKVKIRLYYTDGKPVETGGDYLRIWLKEPSLKANVNGQVIDHRNGTYTGQVLLPWKGHPQVIVSIANTRHHIALIMKYINQYGLLQMMASKFIDPSGKHTEETQCSPKHDAIIVGCHLEDRCNLTDHNYGLPWFCCKPKSPFVNCDDIQTVKSNQSSKINDLTKWISTTQKHMRISDFRIWVAEDLKNHTHLPAPAHFCPEHRPEVTWNYTTPVGYYHNNVWVNRMCKNENNSISCLKNKRFVFFGDSNNRGIYHLLCTMSNSTTFTAHYTKDKPWHKLLMARNSKLNIDLMWAPHNPPFYVGPHQPLDTMQSVGHRLDSTPHDKPIVVILHLFYHLTRTTLSVFRAFVKDARAGVDRLLARAPDSVVIIKGPHSMTFKGVLEPIDYLRRRYEEIWYQEFAGIHDKVFYINAWDRTTGDGNVNVHPTAKIKTDVANDVLSCVCRRNL
ncbi:NXPE family member 3-like [Argopecten irradians]|uniref:NXPE family member 3-like n=1 Tax=Argopecten irradians TaxID=31199 RepID=UPI00371052F6